MRTSGWLFALALGCGGDDVGGSTPDPEPTGCFDSSDVGNVTVDGTRGFASLQPALDAAEPGSELLLCPGFHVGNFLASVPVRIRALEGPEKTVLAGAGGPTLTLPGDSEIAGLTIQSGAPGVVLSSSGALRIEDSLITGNQSEHGGGLVIAEKAEVTLVRTHISDNLARGRGGGVWVQPDAILELTENSSIAGNWAGEFGAGVWLEAAHLRGGVVKDNLLLASSRSLPTGFGDGTVILEADGFGGSGVALTGTGSIVGTEIAWNQGVGGALSVTRGTATLHEVRVHDNDGRSGMGGGLGVAFGTVEGNGTSRFERNMADLGGGGILYDGTVRGVAFADNTAGSHGKLLDGGGLYMVGGVLEDVVSVNNRAMSGAGLYLLAGDLRMERVSLRENEGDWTGGGIYVGGWKNSIEIVDSEIVGNRASAGAGLYFNELVGTITGSDITDNVATGKGGGFYNIRGEIEIVGSRVRSNQASSGGGAYLDRFSSVTVTNTDFGEEEHDNSPDDVETWRGGVFVGFGGDATFVCDDLECTAGP